MDPFVQQIANNVISNGRLLELVMQPSGFVASGRFTGGYSARGGFQPSTGQYFVPRSGITRPRFRVPCRHGSYARAYPTQQSPSHSSQMRPYPTYRNAWQPHPQSSSISSRSDQPYAVYTESRSQRRRERKRANERAVQQYALELSKLVSNSGIQLLPNITLSPFFNTYLAAESGSRVQATDNTEAKDDSVGMIVFYPLGPAVE